MARKRKRSLTGKREQRTRKQLATKKYAERKASGRLMAMSAQTLLRQADLITDEFLHAPGPAHFAVPLFKTFQHAELVEYTQPTEDVVEMPVTGTKPRRSCVPPRYQPYVPPPAKPHPPPQRKKSVPKPVCRLCMKPSTMMVSIFADYQTEESLVEKIQAVTGLVMVDGDGLPRHICTQCNKRVVDWFDYKQLCYASDTKFRALAVAMSQAPPGARFTLKPQHSTGQQVQQPPQLSISPPPSDMQWLGGFQPEQTRLCSSSPETLPNFHSTIVKPEPIDITSYEPFEDTPAEDPVQTLDPVLVKVESNDEAYNESVAGFSMEHEPNSAASVTEFKIEVVEHAVDYGHEARLDSGGDSAGMDVVVDTSGAGAVTSAVLNQECGGEAASVVSDVLTFRRGSGGANVTNVGFTVEGDCDSVSATSEGFVVQKGGGSDSVANQEFTIQGDGDIGSVPSKGFTVPGGSGASVSITKDRLHEGDDDHATIASSVFKGT